MFIASKTRRGSLVVNPQTFYMTKGKQEGIDVLGMKNP